MPRKSDRSRPKKEVRKVKADVTKDDFKVELDEQLEFFDEVVPQMDLAAVVAAIVEDVKDDAVALARLRLVGGYDTYGDGNFHKSVAALRQEQVEEIADAVNYQMFKLWRESKGLE